MEKAVFCVPTGPITLHVPCSSPFWLNSLTSFRCYVEPMLETVAQKLFSGYIHRELWTLTLIEFIC